MGWKVAWLGFLEVTRKLNAQSLLRCLQLQRSKLVFHI